MKIELKNIKINHAFSEETLMFKADVYIDGVKAAFAQNDGRGGSTFYHAHFDGKDSDLVEIRQLIHKAEAYAQSLPPIISDFGGQSFETKSDLEQIIDNLVYEFDSNKEKEKFEKKKQKSMLNHVLVGVPNGNSYSTYKYQCPLASIPKEQLQASIDRIKSQLKTGETILNNNLKSLGIKI